MRAVEAVVDLGGELLVLQLHRHLQRAHSSQLILHAELPHSTGITQQRPAGKECQECVGMESGGVAT